MNSRYIVCLCGLLSFLVACSDPPRYDPCENIDPVLAASSFVVVVEPVGGERIGSPVEVRGCSRTFESNVVWELRGRDGRILASGYTNGGGYSGAAPFEFSAHFEISEAEVGLLEVFEPDESDGEGFPSPRTLIPLALVPDPS